MKQTFSHTYKSYHTRLTSVSAGLAVQRDLHLFKSKSIDLYCEILNIFNEPFDIFTHQSKYYPRRLTSMRMCLAIRRDYFMQSWVMFISFIFPNRSLLTNSHSLPILTLLHYSRSRGSLFYGLIFLFSFKREVVREVFRFYTISV